MKLAKIWARFDIFLLTVPPLLPYLTMFARTSTRIALQVYHCEYAAITHESKLNRNDA